MEPIGQSIVALWNELTLEAIRAGSAKPTATTYELHLSSAAVYDAWAAFDPDAYGHYSEISTSLGQMVENKEEAVSFAAYTALSQLYPDHAAQFEAFLIELGYDPADAVAGTGTAAGVGTLAAQNVFAARVDDGSNAENGFDDTSGYTPVNSADPTTGRAPGGEDFDPNHWQPLRVPTGSLTDEFGVPISDDNDPDSFVDQIALTPHWGGVDPFALTSGDQFRPDAPPQLGDMSVYIDGTGAVTTNDQAYRDQIEEVLNVSATLTTQQKVIAELWADGPRTESPPGHWNQIAQDIALREGHGIDEDAKMFFALNAAVFDAGIATWEAKYAYDYIRPQSAIRDLYFDQTVAAWGGVNQGRQDILGQEWQPYQNVTFVTPPFPEFVSGHSTFSMAAANTIAAFVGSDAYYDGTSLSNYDLDGVEGIDLLGQYVTDELTFEDFGDGPPIVLQWETLTEAALEAGASRIFGGIHIQDGNLRGLEVGEQVADNAQVRWEALFTRGGDDSIETDSAGGLTIAGAGDDTVTGNSGDDMIEGGSGNDSLIGGDGDDTATYAGDLDDHSIVVSANSVTVSDNGSNGAGTDTLEGIEALQFGDDASFVNDGSINLDVLQSVYGVSEDDLSLLVTLYDAYYQRAPDAFGLLFWASAVANGTSVSEIAELFYNEFIAVATFPADLTTGDLVDSAYSTLLDRQADTAGRAFWIDALDSGGISFSELTTSFIDGVRANSDAGDDLQTLEDKVDVGLSFALINGLTNEFNAFQVLQTYDRDDREASLAAVQELIDGYVADAPGTEATVQVVGLVDDPFLV